MSPSRPVEPWWADRSRPNHRRPAARGAGARRPFGATWWGRAWLDALEHRAGLDRNRLPRGRSYARSGAVGELAIDAGTVRAEVQGSRAKPYVVVVRVPAFTAAEWELVLDTMAGRLGHAAALLDGELPPEVVADVAAAGLSLLPTTGEVLPQCSCPDWAIPCKHAAAVCYLVADVLDGDPFALLRLRGRDRDSVLSALRSRRGGAGSGAEGVGSAGSGSAGAAADPGLLARDVYAVWRARAGGGASAGADAGAGAGADAGDSLVAGAWTPLAPLPAPARPGRPAVPVVDPGSVSDVDLDGLARLASDTAHRAWALALRTGDGGLALTREEDIARRADDALGTRSTHALARAATVSARDLTSWALAWRYGGADGLLVLREAWSPPAAEMAAGRTALLAGQPGTVAMWRNRATQGRRQLRLDAEGRWWLFRKAQEQWDLAGPPADSPRAALASTE